MLPKPTLECEWETHNWRIMLLQKSKIQVTQVVFTLSFINSCEVKCSNFVGGWQKKRIKREIFSIHGYLLSNDCNFHSEVLWMWSWSTILGSRCEWRHWKKVFSKTTYLRQHLWIYMWLFRLRSRSKNKMCLIEGCRWASVWKLNKSDSVGFAVAACYEKNRCERLVLF